MSIFDPMTEKFSASQFDLLRKMELPQTEVKEISRDFHGNCWIIQEGMV
jgi:hypothetical protein